MQEPPSARGILQWGNWLLQPYFGTLPTLPEVQGCPARGWRGLARLGEGRIYLSGKSRLGFWVCSGCWVGCGIVIWFGCL